MASEVSTFSEGSLIDFLKQEYGLDIVLVEHLTRGSANIFKVNTSDGRCFLIKEFQSEFPEDRIKMEDEILRYINDHNDKKICYPTYYSTLGHRLISYYKGHAVIAQFYIEGKTIGSFQGNRQQIKNSAEVFAEIVNIMQSFSRPLKILDFSQTKELIDCAIQKHLDILKYLQDEKSKKEVEVKIGYLNAMSHMDLSGLEHVTYANTHGDYSVFQCIYDNAGKIKAVVDFLSAKKMPIIIELVRSFVYLGKFNSYSHLDIKGLCEYIYYFDQKSDIHLTKYDFDNLILAYLIRISVSDFGYVNNSPKHLEIAHQLFLQSEYLFLNYSYIVEEVQKCLNGLYMKAYN